MKTPKECVECVECAKNPLFRDEGKKVYVYGQKTILCEYHQKELLTELEHNPALRNSYLRNAKKV